MGIQKWKVYYISLNELSGSVNCIYLLHQEGGHKICQIGANHCRFGWFLLFSCLLFLKQFCSCEEISNKIDHLLSKVWAKNYHKNIDNNEWQIVSLILEVSNNYFQWTVLNTVYFI